MGNFLIRPYYNKMAEKIDSPLATRNKSPDFTAFDVSLMKGYSVSSGSILELGAGTGLLLNEIMDGYARVVAVEMYPEFSRFIRRDDHVSVYNVDILDFQTSECFDVVIMFGVANFFSEDEVSRVYKRSLSWLKTGGRLIIKHQMGRHEDVQVSGFSEELQAEYYSEYRTLERECALLSSAGYQIERTGPVYPSEFNRWPNTYFMFIVAQPNNY